jgi:hypothetical protein
LYHVGTRVVWPSPRRRPLYRWLMGVAIVL